MGCRVAVAALVVAAWLVAGSAAGATSTQLCSGYAGCSLAPYSAHGYPNHSATSYWNMDSGDDCPNYVAFVESTVYGVPEPDFNLGNGTDWAANAAAHGLVVNDTPVVGSVATWNGGDAGIGPGGHVAIVEAVGPHDSYIWISQQHMLDAGNGFDWEQIYRDGQGAWEPWPDHFIQFVGRSRAPFIANGVVVEETGNPRDFVMAGGAPLYLSSWSSIGGRAPVTVLSASQWSRLRRFPRDRTLLSVEGSDYVIAGGAPLYVSDPGVIDGNGVAVAVDDWDVANAGRRLAHLDPVPLDGTVVEGYPSRTYWELTGGQREPTPPSSSAIAVDDADLRSFPVLASAGAPSLQSDAIRDSPSDAPPRRFYALASPVWDPIGRAVSLVVRGLPTSGAGVVMFSSQGTVLCVARVVRASAHCDSTRDLRPRRYRVVAIYASSASLTFARAVTSFAVK